MVLGRKGKLRQRQRKKGRGGKTLALWNGWGLNCKPIELGSRLGGKFEGGFTPGQGEKHETILGRHGEDVVFSNQKEEGRHEIISAETLVLWVVLIRRVLLNKGRKKIATTQVRKVVAASRRSSLLV